MAKKIVKPETRKLILIEEKKLPDVIRKAFSLIDQTNNLNEKINIIVTAIKKEFEG